MHRSCPSTLLKTTIVLSAALSSFAAHADYVQTNLVSDISGFATITDPNLINPWGVSHSPTSPFWVSDQGANVATLYSVSGGNVNKVRLMVSIPSSGPPQGPTGQVNNPFTSAGNSAFVVGSAPANFIFANLNGTISAWNGAEPTRKSQPRRRAPSTPGWPSPGTPRPRRPFTRRMARRIILTFSTALSRPSAHREALLIQFPRDWFPSMFKRSVEMST